MSERLTDLTPARPDTDANEGASYAPRIPWKWLILVIGGVAGLFTFYYMRQDRRQEALRSQMLTLHEDQLHDVTERYLAFRRRLETWVQEAAAAGAPEQWVDPRLNLAGLRAGEGLYLRISADWADSPERIEGAALAMEPDAITRCMGIAPMSARGLYEKGYFLTPEWVDQVRTEPDMMALRVLDDQLGRHIQVDAPVVLTMMQADWFMLVLEQGESRAEHPVDVFLYDLRENRQLMRARIQGRGLLVPVRLRFEGAGQAPSGPQRVRSPGATDCSIASQIRSLTGSDPVEIQSGDALAAAAARAAEAATSESAPRDPPPGETPALAPDAPAQGDQGTPQE